MQRIKIVANPPGTVKTYRAVNSGPVGRVFALPGLFVTMLAMA